ncbi:MAG: cellulase family glycosylhydrolase [Clostridia bacterium]|nr:cellulase family glycosylhydrolase [Clostridia bacterium]
MKEFMLGCNYWASNAGTEMWREWDKNVVEEDLKRLSEYGVTHARVFPNWRDFQPIIPIMTSGNNIIEYRLKDEALEHNPYYLSEEMLDRFDVFCDLCDKYNIKLIVGLITGWMSGRTFVPEFLAGRDLFCDTTALILQQKFIAGFVRRFKNRSCICAWDLGNECNCLTRAKSREIAQNWTSIISNAIRANDHTRPVISGMHGLGMENECWTLQDQGFYTDMVTTHPYPYWVEHCSKDYFLDYRTMMHATSQTKLYSDISGRPCLVEEIGTMSPTICNDQCGALFLRANLYSAYINGSEGLLWWCANEQSNLTTVPYTTNMCEVELGMFFEDGTPKPLMKEFCEFADFLNTTKLELPKAQEDAVCILTQEQDQWGVAYMSFCLARQIDVNLRFAYADDGIPDADVYMLPSINGIHVMPAENYKKLQEKVKNGARLYISNDDGFLSGFKALTGVEIVDGNFKNTQGEITLDGEKIEFTRRRNALLQSVGADTVAKDQNGDIAISSFKLGAGEVVYVNFPLERMLLDKNRAFDDNKHKVYEYFFKKELAGKKVVSKNPKVSVTTHVGEDKTYIAVMSYSKNKEKTELEFNGCRADEIFIGNLDELEPFSAVIFSIK